MPEIVIHAPSRELLDRIEQELREPVPAPIAALARELAQRAPGAVAAILFYGSALREPALDGLLDFYVLLDDVGAWPSSTLAALANRLLPPNVAYVEARIDGMPLRAKYALMSVAQFAAAARPGAIDTTIWARFSQPCRCVHVRGDADFATVAAAVAGATITAAHWAAQLGPDTGTALDYWRALYGRTYQAELRVEAGGRRSADLVALNAARYEALLPPAWSAAGIAYTVAPDGRLAADAAHRSSTRWALRRKLARPLNLLRLLKAAFTFDGAADYVAWKVERHSGVRLELKDWQRRHPVLAAPGIYLQLRRKGLLR